MSYTQYQQYGGNPYDNGPGAEAGQAGAVRPSHLEEMRCEIFRRIIADSIFSV